MVTVAPDALLLDAHALVWFAVEPERIPERTLARIRDRSVTVYVSSLTAWELGIKVSLGRLPAAEPLVDRFHESLARYGFRELAFTSAHALTASRLDWTHRDPIDRALVAQARDEHLALVTADAAIRAFPDEGTIW